MSAGRGYLTLLAVALRMIHITGQGTIVIGGLFDQDDPDPMPEVAFRYGVEEANRLRADPDYNFTAQVERVPVYDGFHTAKRVCQLLGMGVAAVFGPSVPSTALHVQSICDSKNVPHIETRWQYTSSRTNVFFSANVHPDTAILSQAYADILAAYGWRKMYVVYEDNDSLVRLQNLLKMPDANNKISIVVRQLSVDGDYKPLMRMIQNAGGTHLVVDCSPSKVYEVLKQAQQIGMVTKSYHFFFTTLDLHTVPLQDFQYARCNISGVRLVDTSDPRVVDTVQKWKNAEIERGFTAPLSVTKLTTEAALLYDAVLLFSRAVDGLKEGRYIRTTPLNCDSDEPWPHGSSLLNYMQIEQVTGLTGHLQFDHRRRRSSFSLDILTLVDSGLLKAGFWRPEGVTISGAGNKTHIIPSIKNQNLIVTTLIKPPYTMEKESSEELVGNDRYEGFCVDIIEELSKELKFNYTIKLNEESAPGTKNAAGEWNGMIGELLRGQADLAIADLTITSDREAAVDFTMQFMNLGISILYRKPTRQPPRLFSFLSPLSLNVWLYMLAALVGVSLLLFVLARFTPYEWESPHPCSPDQELQNIFNLQNCLWFCIGTLMQQGCDFLPKAVSTRLMAGIWWFFTLIMVSSYTANLAAFLTVERMESPIESVDDLASQSKIKYGTYANGSTATFFRTSNIDQYKNMWHVMENLGSEVLLGINDGITKVKNSSGLYAYFMESSTIEYVVERECQLSQIGGLLDSKGYGIALPPDSPWTSQLNEGLLKLQEGGKLAALKEKWWTHQGENCADDGGGTSASALDLENVGGVFVCLMGGMVVATVIAMFEFMWHLRSQAKEEDTSVLAAMGDELKFIMRCRGSTRPVRHPLSRESLERPGSNGEERGLIPFNVVKNHGGERIDARLAS